MLTDVYCEGKLIGCFTDDELEVWFLLCWDEGKEYQMFSFTGPTAMQYSFNGEKGSYPWIH